MLLVRAVPGGNAWNVVCVAPVTPPIAQAATCAPIRYGRSGAWVCSLSHTCYGEEAAAASVRPRYNAMYARGLCALPSRTLKQSLRVQALVGCCVQGTNALRTVMSVTAQKDLRQLLSFAREG